MKKTTYKIVFNRLNKLNKDRKGLVQIECYLNGKRKYLSTGIKTEPKYWNSKISRIKTNHSEYIELNRLIDKQLRNVEDFEFSQIEKNGTFFLDDLMKLNKNNIYIKNDFFAFCWESLANNTSVSKATINHHKVMLRKLEKYKKNVSFNDINFSFVKGFDDFLRKEGLHQNTIGSQHKNLKTYIHLAINQGLFSADNYPYKSFKVKKIPTKRSFLTLDEVKALENVRFTESTRHIEKVRDMFVFSCYTGLRFSDVQGLTNRDIVIQNDEYLIEIRQIKTKDFVKLPVSLLFNGKAVDIIKKYKEDFPEKYLFPRISNQKANLKLKVVALVAGIDKNLSFHLSRHTFGTNLASATSDQFLIKELMGHTDIKTSMVYIHISQEQIRNKLRNTKWE